MLDRPVGLAESVAPSFHAVALSNYSNSYRRLQPSRSISLEQASIRHPPGVIRDESQTAAKELCFHHGRANTAYRLGKLSDGSDSAELFCKLQSAPKLKRQQIIMNKGSARRSENILAEKARILLREFYYIGTNVGGESEVVLASRRRVGGRAGPENNRG
jgi:hypothetical protein